MGRPVTVTELIVQLNRFMDLGFEDAPIYLETWEVDDNGEEITSGEWGTGEINSVRRSIKLSIDKLENLSVIISSRPHRTYVKIDEQQ